MALLAGLLALLWLLLLWLLLELLLRLDLLLLGLLLLELLLGLLLELLLWLLELLGLLLELLLWLLLDLLPGLLAHLLLGRLLPGLLAHLLLGRLLPGLLTHLLLGRLLSHLLPLGLELPGLWVPRRHLVLLLGLPVCRLQLTRNLLWCHTGCTLRTGLCRLLLWETDLLVKLALLLFALLPVLGRLLDELTGLGVTGLALGLDGLVILEGLALAETMPLRDAALTLLALLTVLLCLLSLLALLLLPLLLISLVTHGSIGGVRR